MSRLGYGALLSGGLSLSSLEVLIMFDCGRKWNTTGVMDHQADGVQQSGRAANPSSPTSNRGVVMAGIQCINIPFAGEMAPLGI